MNTPNIKITHSDDEKICAIAYDEKGHVIEFFKLHENHPAFKQNWEDNKVINYLRNQLINDNRTIGNPKYGKVNC